MFVLQVHKPTIHDLSHNISNTIYEIPSRFLHFQCHFLSDMHIILQHIYARIMLEYDAVIFATVESQGGAL